MGSMYHMCVCVWGGVVEGKIIKVELCVGGGGGGASWLKVGRQVGEVYAMYAKQLMRV